MEKEKTLKENLEFLIQQYEREIRIQENAKKPDYNLIEIYSVSIDDLKFAIEISKKGD